MDQIINLIIPFITLAILSVMIDKFTLFLEGVMHKIPKLPDVFEWWVAYFLVLGFSTVVCWQGDFRFFDYLNLYFPMWLDYLMTGLVISGGSAFVRTQFSMIDSIPSAVMGVTSSFTRMVGKSKKTKETIDSIDTSTNISTGSYYSDSSTDSSATEEYNPDDYPAAVEVDTTDSNRYSDDI